jgi:TPR repeat protein
MRKIFPLLIAVLFSFLPPALAELPEVNAAPPAGGAAGAFSSLKMLAEGAKIEARYRSGVTCSISDGIEADPERAVHWLELAADQNSEDDC